MGAECFLYLFTLKSLKIKKSSYTVAVVHVVAKVSYQLFNKLTQHLVCIHFFISFRYVLSQKLVLKLSVLHSKCVLNFYWLLQISDLESFCTTCKLTQNIGALHWCTIIRQSRGELQKKINTLLSFSWLYFCIYCHEKSQMSTLTHTHIHTYTHCHDMSCHKMLTGAKSNQTWSSVFHNSELLFNL